MCDESNIILDLEEGEQEADDTENLSHAEMVEKQLAELLARGSGDSEEEEEDDSEIEEDDEEEIEEDEDEEEDVTDLSHAELIERQLAEIIGEDNRNYARHALGREPTLGDLVVHYAQNGGPEDFQKRHGKPTCIVRIDYYD